MHNNRLVKDVTFEEIAQEFIEFVDLKGFFYNYQLALNIYGKEQCINRLAEDLKQASENVHDGRIDTALILDTGYVIFDWCKADEGPEFWCLMERCWQDFCRLILLPAYEECGLLEDIEND